MVYQIWLLLLLTFPFNNFYFYISWRPTIVEVESLSEEGHDLPNLPTTGELGPEAIMREVYGTKTLLRLAAS